jgi:hypothetical protein
MADEPWRVECRLCERPRMGAARRRRRRLPARRRANVAARRRKPAKRLKPRRTAVRQPPPTANSSHRRPRQRQRRTLSSKEVATQLAVSHRQLHFWVTKGWIPGSFPMGVAASRSGPLSRSTPPSRSRHGWRSPVRSKPTDHTRPPSASLSDTGRLPFEGAGECWDTRRHGRGRRAACGSRFVTRTAACRSERDPQWVAAHPGSAAHRPPGAERSDQPHPAWEMLMVLDREPFVRAPGTWTT